MTKNKLKGVWVEYEIMIDTKLSQTEKFIYSLILLFSRINNSCTILNSYLAELFSISKTQVSKVINSLKAKGYIEIEIIRNDKKQITSRVITPIKLFGNTYTTNVDGPNKDNFIIPIEEKFKDKKIYNNKNIKNNINVLPNMFRAEQYDIDFNDDSLYANLR